MAALSLAAVLCMSLWFVSAAILPEIVAEGGLGPGRAAALSSAVQIGFVLGALGLAVHGTADRFDPRLVIAASGLFAAAANLALLDFWTSSVEGLRYEILERRAFEGGVVQRHVVHGRARGVDLHADVCIVIHVEDDRITRIFEYLDQTAVAAVFAPTA